MKDTYGNLICSLAKRNEKRIVLLVMDGVGDCDNDGKNEINVGSVQVDHGEDFMSWVFKYGW